jgi:hypothetical protein
MTQVKVVPEQAPDPKAGRERSVSGFNVPYFDLSDSIEVARVVRDSGGRMNREQLAGLLKYTSTNSGAFKTRVSAAKAFGVVDQPEPNSDLIAITARGTSIVAPVSDAEALKAKIDAFLAIPLFKLIYDEYRGRELPADIGLANLFENTHKMLDTRAMPSVKVMMASAETAGLFKINGAASRKMVMPILSGAGAATLEGPRIQDPPPRIDLGRNGSGGGGGDGGGEPPDIDPTFLALLARLPKSGTQLSKTRRAQVIAALTAAVNWIYPDPEDA